MREHENVEWFHLRVQVCWWCTPCSVGDFVRLLTLCCPLGCPQLSGKTTGAYLAPSTGLSTAHLHIDAKINGKPSVCSQYNKWPIQTDTYHTPEPALTHCHKPCVELCDKSPKWRQMKTNCIYNMTDLVLYLRESNAGNTMTFGDKVGTKNAKLTMCWCKIHSLFT